MSRVGIGLLGDLPPRAAAESLAGWNGPVWLAESPVGADPLVSAAALVCARPGRPIGFAVLVSAVRHAWAAVNACRTLTTLESEVRLGIGLGDRIWTTRAGVEGRTTVDALQGELERLRAQLRTAEPAWARHGSPARPAIPLYVGCEGPRMLQTAAHTVDGIILPFLRTDRYLRQRGALVRDARRSVRVVAEVVVGVGESSEQAAAGLQQWLRYITAAPRYRAILIEAGLDPVEAEDYQSRVGRGDADAALPLAPLEKLAVLGRVEDCARSIASRFMSWADEVVLVGPGRRLADLAAVGRALASRAVGDDANTLPMGGGERKPCSSESA